MKEIYDLNEQFFELYARINEYSSDMTKRQTDAMTSRLLKQYEVEFKKLETQKLIRDKREIYEIKTQKGYYLPKRKLFLFKNKLAKLISQDIKNTAKEYYEKYFNKKIELLSQDGEEVEDENVMQTQTEEQENEPGEKEEIPLSET
ncbi:MAG: hypothetical protein IKJ14_01050 [Clostridia bacterium]|nr:hypothetical protein [Clostridia bacterium]